MVGKKHLLKYQRHILIVNLLNNMANEEVIKMSKLKKLERNTEDKALRKAQGINELK